MHLAVMAPAERNRKLITYLAAEGVQPRKSQVMGIGGSTAANEAGLFGNRSHMLPVASPAWRRERKHGFADSLPVPVTWVRRQLRRSVIYECFVCTAHS
jgi:hypothetical protein